MGRSIASPADGPGTPLSVQSVSVPPFPTAPYRPSTPQLPSPSKLPWLQLSGTGFSMPSVRALEACAGDAMERPVGSRSGPSTSRSMSTLSSTCSGLPPLPNFAIDENMAMQHSLRHLARSSRVGMSRNSTYRVDLDGSQEQLAVQTPGLKRDPATANSKTNCWVAAQERKESLLRRSLSQSLPRKRSRLKRMLSRTHKVCCMAVRTLKGL